VHFSCACACVLVATTVACFQVQLHGAEEVRDVLTLILFKAAFICSYRGTLRTIHLSRSWFYLYF
jgi:hypothetical protein